MSVPRESKQISKRGASSQRKTSYSNIFVFILLISIVAVFVFLQRKGLLQDPNAAQPLSVASPSSESIQLATPANASSGILSSSESPHTEQSSKQNKKPEENFKSLLKDVRSKDVLARNKALNAFKNRSAEKAALQRFKEELRAVDASDEAFPQLIAALGAVGSPEIQQTLIELVRERQQDWRAFSSIVPVLAGVENPTQETIDALVEFSRFPDADFSSTASLALGGVVHTLSKTNPARGEQLLESYLRRIEQPHGNLEELKESLAVLGNAGLPATASAIISLTSHPRADVRAEATMALRFIRTPYVERRLLSILERDADVEVRMRAVDAFIQGPVPKESLPVVKRILEQRNSSPKILREHVIDLIAHLELQGDDRSNLRQWLTSFANSEQDLDIKKKALAVVPEQSTAQ
ncbi:hypothetical protein EBU99_10115 [bacterium]|nr:hypothetical protein [bacterium]